MNVFMHLVRIAAVFLITVFALGAVLPGQPGVELNLHFETPFIQTTESTVYLPIVIAGPTQPISWSTLAGNPERTSWIPEEASGFLSPLWYKQFEPYIPPNVVFFHCRLSLNLEDHLGRIR